jgi:hypothetical protein
MAKEMDKERSKLRRKIGQKWEGKPIRMLDDHSVDELDIVLNILVTNAYSLDWVVGLQTVCKSDMATSFPFSRLEVKDLMNNSASRGHISN